MALKRNNLKQTESTQLKAIAAINKAGTLIDSVPKVIDGFNQIKEEVAAIKLDMDLGLKQYEASIEEKKMELDTSLADKTKEVEDKFKVLEEEAHDANKENNNILEELDYGLEKAVERKSIEAAEKIATEYKKVIVDAKKYSEMNLEHINLLEEVKAECAKEVEVAILKTEKVENAKVKAIKQEKAVLEAKFEAQEKQIERLLSDNQYLREQVVSGREEITKAVGAASPTFNQITETKK